MNRRVDILAIGLVATVWILDALGGVNFGNNFENFAVRLTGFAAILLGLTCLLNFLQGKGMRSRFFPLADLVENKHATFFLRLKLLLASIFSLSMGLVFLLF